MTPARWAELNGLNEQTVWKWCREGLMPGYVEVNKNPSGRWFIFDPHFEQSSEESSIESKVVCYARVSTGSQKDDLTRQGDRLLSFAVKSGFENVELVKEIASGMNGKRRELNKILSNSTINTIIVEHRERLTRINFELIESALKAQGRRIIVLDNEEVEDDLVRDITEVMTSFCARMYGKRGAKNRAKAALERAAGENVV